MVYSLDFNGGLPSQFSGPSNSIEGVQGYAGLGTGSNVFSGSLLRNSSAGNPAASTALTLTGLAPHVSVDLGFLLAVIDSWDGASSTVGGSQRVGDYFNIRLDGVLIFRQAFDTFDPADGYAYPTGGLLAHGQLGFNSIHPDSAYDMGLEPTLRNIPHASSVLTIEWFADGSGWDGGMDESWGIDNLRITLNPVPEPSSLVSAALGLAALAGYAGWKRRWHLHPR
jgi:hypothetical protein